MYVEIYWCQDCITHQNVIVLVPEDDILYLSLYDAPGTTCKQFKKAQIIGLIHDNI